ncbi:hypothetical protein O0L34_g9607 [Tuta absoluta]|nr:hypothetical protein O0L34_g9607 [Tuta absoluta]
MNIFFKKFNAKPNQVKVTVFYETLCPASVNYLTKTLRPTVEMLGQRLDVHLVPYGFTEIRRMNRRFQTQCQHGPPECHGNRLHACAIDVIGNSTLSAIFNACLMEYTQYREGIGHDFATALTTCSSLHNVPSNDISQCMSSERGNFLQKLYGDETCGLPLLAYVPYVLINGAEDTSSEDLATVLCRKLIPPPSVCLLRRKYN